ncbi:MAG TPA: alpha-1,4-glucan--maltose-1-phosphate maltosyltransferase [Pirellulales bacterium]
MPSSGKTSWPRSIHLPLPPRDLVVHRVVIEGISPQVDGGRFPIKRVVADEVTVEADIFAEGHEVLVCVLQFCRADDGVWQEQVMQPLGNDRWRADFPVDKVGCWIYRMIGWVDRFHTWRGELKKRAEAGQDLHIDLLIGAELVAAAAGRAVKQTDADQLAAFAARIVAADNPPQIDQAARYATAIDESLLKLMDWHADRSAATTSPILEMVVDEAKAATSAWYELFPRSCSPTPGKHGTLRDVIARLPYVSEMGFDVLYLPPIHPVGAAFRKGKNNQEKAAPGDVGSVWAIGGEAGGHTAIHPELGTLEDFRALVAAAAEQKIELALDIAFQCSPDHPYVREHPQWFRSRPDGTIQYAENPPKKYQDIYPFDFACDDWRALWEELKNVFLFWVAQGIRIFRVDNPHTKPFPFWEWCLAEVKRVRPDAIFLAEAFTRPKIVYRLAKLGFTQSYTYFTWRNSKQELTEYFTELSQPALTDIFRPNLWTNTPDILHEYLQHGGRAAFVIRAVLAATLSPNWGLYGPAYELLDGTPRDPGSEEYLNSEKYEIKTWDVNRPDSIREVLARLNRIRRAEPALKRMQHLTFHTIDNPQLIAYSHRTADAKNIVLVVVNLDPHQTQTGPLELPADRFGIGGTLEVADLLADKTYRWDGPKVRIELEPSASPAQIFKIR